MKNIYLNMVCFFMLLLYSCKPDCSSDQITPAEESFISYQVGDKSFFKNDSTGIIDTFLVTARHKINYCQSCQCEAAIKGISVEIASKVIAHNQIDITRYHNNYQGPYLNVEGENSFPLVGVSPQTMTINGTTYNDIYSSSIDTTNFTNSMKLWKLNYSASHGFVQFFMKNGVTWRKL